VAVDAEAGEVCCGGGEAGRSRSGERGAHIFSP
jgi:hypothetical protein